MKIKVFLYIIIISITVTKVFCYGFSFICIITLVRGCMSQSKKTKKKTPVGNLFKYEYKVMQDKYTFESDENEPQKEKLGFSED